MSYSTHIACAVVHHLGWQNGIYTDKMRSDRENVRKRLCRCFRNLPPVNQNNCSSGCEMFLRRYFVRVTSIKYGKPKNEHGAHTRNCISFFLTFFAQKLFHIQWASVETLFFFSLSRFHSRLNISYKLIRTYIV